MEQKKTPKRRSPYQRSRRLQGKYLSWLLVGCIVLVLVLSLLVKDKDFSESENRSLAQFPKLSDVMDGTILSDLGDYFADQFPGRDLWMSLNLGVNRLLGQKEASGVYLCEDDYLMQVPSAPNTEQVERNLAAINAFGESHSGLNLVMSVVPNAVTVHADKLPANAPVRDQAADLSLLKSGLTAGTFVDVSTTLKAHSDEYLFYKTDHHWTSLGAYYAFADIAGVLNLSAPLPESYTVHPVSTTFEGTLSSKSGSHSAVDTVEIYVPDTAIDYYVSYPDGRNISSLYHRDALNVKDHYTVFFGGNHSRVDITTTANTGRCLLLFKDSYANCMVQFLYPYFDHITMIDPRYYYDNVELVIKSEAITDVLFLYNLDTYLGDTSLADVLVSE
jgi:hypothetical protein